MSRAGKEGCSCAEGFSFADGFRPRNYQTGHVTALVAAAAVVALVAGASHFAASPARAHELGFTRATLFLFGDGSFRAELVVDLDALALGVPQDSDNDELVRTLQALSQEDLEALIERLRQTFLRRVRIRFDGEAITPEVGFPQHRGTPADRRPSPEAEAAPSLIGLTARLEGRVPEGARELTFQASRAFPQVHLSVVDLRHAQGTQDARGLDRESVVADPAGLEEWVTFRQVLDLGDRSDPYPLDRPPPEPTTLAVIRQYVALGFEHILPLGLDHILFVLGLYLLNTAWRPLLAQVTAFTVAHTATLALSTYDVVSMSPGIVEPLIALSIAYVALENVATTELKPWRPALVFSFGLLHGLGFAGVLAELGLPRGEYLTALLSFNVGVELGQLAVIAIAFVAVGWARSKDWYRQRIAVPISLLIGIVGLYWAVERALGS